MILAGRHLVRLTAPLLLLGLSCGESSLSIRLVFPDAASVDLAGKVVIYALDPADIACADVLGQPPSSFPGQLLAEVAIDLQGGDALRFPSVPMRSMLVAAMVYDKQGRHLMSGCTPAAARPGDDVELVIYLDCAPGRTPCRDADGDGVTSDLDCDDSDPCVSPGFLEASNLCAVAPDTYSGAAYAPCRARLLLAGRAFSPPFCGDGVDQDCDGKDLPCRTDGDCDGYAPPADCDDSDARTNPQATESCDGKDNNCNGAVDEGCAPCDVDGDGHAGQGPTAPGCNLPKDDPDDYDAGIHPQTTSKDNGQEGGTLLGALRGYCSGAKDKDGKLSQREVDHDGDGKPAASDGCPPVACDADGDGYQAASCSPPKSSEDCNDNDPHVFPGAPDRCGDGVAQNCVADSGCSCDGDGDGYCAPADCDDSDSTVHPWAKEICDQTDNDCDQLIDEGNPDLDGNPLPTQRKLCTDDNDGKCAPPCTAGVNCHASGVELTGVCACSALDTSKLYSQDSGNRIACQGENLALASSPRCFQAVQPTTERCDKLDWSCDGKPFVTGQPFAEKGKACGTGVGQCVVGTVEGCDLSRTVDPRIISVMAFHQTDFSPYWVCSSTTRLPAAEQCNGKDDDCDGYGSLGQVAGEDPGWPELDESDADGDGYITCTGCKTSQLPATLKGCGDCAPGDKAVFPGAFEDCDGKDNNCKAGDEGVDKCGADTCCAGQQACRNLSTDISNCGICGTSCDLQVADSCVAGSCSCGATGGECTGSRNCVGGSCQCVENGLCSGCCSGDTCLGGTSAANCGTDGETCTQCTTNNPCKSASCSKGSCALANVPDGQSCSGGTCYGGSCCTGCWDGSVCRTGKTNSYCGTGGATCGTCSTTNPCKIPSCSSGSCKLTVMPNTSACPGGTCYAGSCCTGCWDGMLCLSGTSSSDCGTGGDGCKDCTAQSLTCLGGACE